MGSKSIGSSCRVGVSVGLQEGDTVGSSVGCSTGLDEGFGMVGCDVVGCAVGG